MDQGRWHPFLLSAPAQVNTQTHMCPYTRGRKGGERREGARGESGEREQGRKSSGKKANVMDRYFCAWKIPEVLKLYERD